uniref:DUF4219 domain-containing protein n=1 Tax=Peronospora matthiolae TaxID=2874970 RepID=A0AAV1VMM1_9STRA
MDAMPITTARINKFSGTNFHTWKFEMQMVLGERDLWNVVSGEVKLERCVSTLDQVKFKKKSRKALAIICLTMEDSQLPLVRLAENAYDAWSRLEGHYEKKSLANKLFLCRRFFTTMMGEGDDVLEHINKLKTLAEQLDAIGAPTRSARSKVAESMDPCMGKTKRSCQETTSETNDQERRLVRATSVGNKDIGSRSSPRGSKKTRNDINSSHMTSSKKFVKNYKVFNPVDVHLADDGVVEEIGKGDIMISMKTPRGTKKGVLRACGKSRCYRVICSPWTKGVKSKLGAREGKGIFKLCMTPEASNEANVSS